MPETKKTIQVPVIPARGLVVFPKTVVTLDISRPGSVLALQTAMNVDEKIFIVTQREMSIVHPAYKDLYWIGTVVKIKHVIKRGENEYRLMVEGLYRAQLDQLVQEDPFYLGSIRRIHEKRNQDAVSLEWEAAVRNVKVAFHKYASVMPNISRELIDEVNGQSHPLKLFYTINAHIPMKVENQQAMLEENDLLKRLKMLVETLLEESNIIALQRELINRVESKMDQNQREYFLREQAKMIQDELDLYHEDSAPSTCEQYLKAIQNIQHIDDFSREKLCKEARRLQNMPENSHEGYVITSYLDTVLQLPFDVLTKDHHNLKRAQQILDKDHYGLKEVKERIIEHLAVRAFKPHMKGQILCFVGPPGVGKTSIGHSIADALNRKFVRISLGGVNDEAEIRGHRKTYIGAMPGRIIAGFLQAKSRNPVMLLDEIDKLGSSFKGDPSSAMLEVLDPEQNHIFTDHYIDLPFDLSECFFITTANSAADIPAPLLDRMEMIELSSYTLEEKFHICKEHLIPKQLQKHGLSGKQMRMTEEGIYALIDGYTREAGVRNLERMVGTLCRKTAKMILAKEKKSLLFSEKNLETYLGPKRYLSEKVKWQEDLVGVVNGLAYTTAGGELLQIEASVMDGKGKIQLTGSLGDVMKESANTAISYVRTVADEYGIPKDFYKTKDIHVHLPEGAVPKDGPSAGVALTVAVVSALSHIPVHQNLAMTGEVTLRGRVLPIGGLKEKSIAAFKSGIQTVLIPKENMRDLVRIDPAVKKKLTYIPCERVEEALQISLAFPKNKQKKFHSERRAPSDPQTMGMEL